MIAPVLIFAFGNPGRGDDALGPAFLERIEGLRGSHPEWPDLELLTDFQLQIEHALDLAGRERVLFVDASLTAPPPFSYQQIVAAQDIAYTTHALAPECLLHVYERVTGQAPPPSFLLGIRGMQFELGEPLSPPALRNLAQAIDFATTLLAAPAAPRAADDGAIQCALRCPARGSNSDPMIARPSTLAD